MQVQNGPLHHEHAALGAKFGDFGGWLMPLEYAGGGVLAEHGAVREHVGVFDVSHMGTFAVRGPDARAAVNDVFTNDLTQIDENGAQYSLLCSGSGGVVDDLLVYVRSDDDLFVIPNAANTQIVIATVESILEPTGVAVEDLSASTAILAVQGPQSAELLGELELPTGHDYLTFVDTQTQFGPVIVARTGYTGEHGYELMMPIAAAQELWPRIVELCQALGGLPCGLGARDTLRTEMGYPLYGHELGLEVSPLEANLSWAIGWDKPAFVGCAELTKARAQGPPRRLRALRCLDRGVPRPGMSVRRLDGDVQILGTLTSGTFSPTLRTGIALALLAPDVLIGDEVVIDVRGRPCRARVVKPPFVDADPRR